MMVYLVLLGFIVWGFVDIKWSSYEHLGGEIDCTKDRSIIAFWQFFVIFTLNAFVYQLLRC